MSKKPYTMLSNGCRFWGVASDDMADFLGVYGTPIKSSHLHPDLVCQPLKEPEQEKEGSVNGKHP